MSYDKNGGFRWITQIGGFGDEDEWGLAFYSYAHNKYETSVFPNGKFFDTPEMAIEVAADFHL